MANLSVNNKVLRYKSTSYQISQIASAKPLPEKKTPRKIEPVSLGSIKFVVPISVVLGLLGFIFFMAENIYGLFLILLCVCCVIYCAMVLTDYYRAKNSDPYNYMYGISLRMSNGDDPVFYSSNKKMIFQVQNAIISAMNGDENVAISFDNANINISNSSDFDIGNFKNDKD